MESTLDLSEAFEKDLFDKEGPYATVYLPKDARSNTAGARQQRWDSVRHHLREARMPAEHVERVEEAVTAPSTAGGRAIVLSYDGHLWSEDFPTSHDEFTVAALPRLVPFLAARQACLEVVDVRIDRTGADVALRKGMHETLEERTVEGSHDVIHKPEAGGWSQRRFEDRAEDSWEMNAKEVARYVDELVRTHGPAGVIVSGDVRAVQFLQEHLGAAARKLCHVLPTGHGRAVDGGERAHREALEAAVLQVSAERTRETLERYRQARAQRGRAASGLEEVAEAFRRAQVETLLLPNRHLDEELCFGSDATDVALDAASLEEMGREATCGPADAVLVRAALGTSAKVVVVEPGDLDSVAAILRYSD